jgi:hypothetical protein
MDTLTLLLSSLVCTQTNVAPVVEGSVAFTKLMLRYESVMITSASWVVIQAIQKGVPVVSNHAAFVRIKPIAAVILSIGMAFMPSFRLGAWDETLLYGVALGSITGLGQKILKQTLLGQDPRIHPVIDDPELRKQIDAHLAAKSMGDSGVVGRKRLREKLKHLVT